MTILSVDLINLSGNCDEKGNITAQNVYQVKTTSILDGPGGVRWAGPARASLHHDLNCWATNSNAQYSKRAGDGSGNEEYYWTLTVDFDNKPGSQYDDPLDKPTVWGTGFSDYEQPMEEDEDGNPCVFSNKLPMDPAIMQRVSNFVMTATKNYASFPTSLLSTYKNKKNSGTFRGFPAGMVLCQNATSSEQHDENIGTYLEVTWSFEVDVKYWKKIVINQGMIDINGDLIKDEKGNFVNTNVILNSDGEKLAAGTEPTIANGGLLEFKQYGEIDFDGMGL